MVATRLEAIGGGREMALGGDGGTAIVAVAPEGKREGMMVSTS